MQQTVIYKVLSDIEQRAEVGKAHYGTPLMTHNGRDALQDAYEEALDLAMYLAQAILEREDHENTTLEQGAVISTEGRNL